MRSVTTLRELAERSGVSIATVSRALNGDPRVSPAVRERVLSLADELEYTPNAAARTLVRQPSDLLAVVIRRSAAQRHLPVELVIRESCGTPRVARRG
jgi:DNA-binding LacI/PurR family transcriptional regulator